MAELVVDRITWKLVKERAEEDETEIAEYISKENYHYLYEPISWEVLSILLENVNYTSYHMIISVIDEEQFGILYETKNRNDYFHRRVINDWAISNYENPEHD
jgi:hypothetical protein